MRTQWIFLNACGCPVGVLEGSTAAVEYDAWREFYGRPRDIRAAQARGVRAERVSHEVYVRDFEPKMFSTYTCPHQSAVAGAPS